MERTIRVLNEMVRDGVVPRYAIGGGIGALFYIEPFETHDLDVFTDIPVVNGIVTMAPISSYLRKRGYDLQDDLYLIDGIPVQFLPVTTGLVDEAVREAVELSVGAERARVLRAEHLVAIMLRVGRAAKDLPRAMVMLEQATVDMDRLQSILSRYGLSEQYRRMVGGDSH